MESMRTKLYCTFFDTLYYYPRTQSLVDVSEKNPCHILTLTNANDSRASAVARARLPGKREHKTNVRIKEKFEILQECDRS